MRPKRPKTRISGKGNKRRRRWVDADGMIYEWDYQHGTVEKYDRTGKHLGEFDRHGNKVSPRDPTKKVER